MTSLPTSDMRCAWMRQPGFVLVAVLSLACGIGLNTAVFSIINAIFLQGIRGVPAADRVVSIGERVPFTTFRRCATRLRRWTASRPGSRSGSTSGSATRSCAPSCRWSRTTTSRRSASCPRAADSSPPRREARCRRRVHEVVLDYEFWMQDAGRRPGVIGQQILINRVPATILGIAPRSFHGFGPERPPLWMPMGMLPAVRGSGAQWEDPAESGWRIFGRLKAGGVGRTGERGAADDGRAVAGPVSERPTDRLGRARKCGAVRSPPRNGSSSCSSSCCRWSSSR